MLRAVGLGFAILVGVTPAAAAPAGFAHSFSFSQSGAPWEVPGGRTSTTSGSGTVVVAAPLRPGPLGFQIQRATLRGSITFAHRDVVSGGPMLRLTLRALSASLTAFADGSRFIGFRVRVVSSNDPTCPTGRVGDLYISDGVSSKDAIRMFLCPPDQEWYYETTRGYGVASVTIG